MTERVDLSEFRAGFVAESEDHLRASRASLLELDAAARQNRTSPKAVRDLYRSFHTIKGLAAMVGVEPIVELAHRMESVLRTADRAGGHLAAEALDVLVRGLEGIERRLHEVARGDDVSPPPQRLLHELDALEPHAAQHAPEADVELDLEPSLRERLTTSETTQLVDGIKRGLRAVRLDFVPTPDRAARGLNITTVRQGLSELGEIVRVLPASRPHSQGAPVGLAFVLLVVTSADDAALAAAVGADEDDPVPIASITGKRGEASAEASEPAIPPMAETSAVRVDVHRLDEGLRALSGLLVSQFRLARAIAAIPDRGPEMQALRAVADEQARQLRDMRKALLQLRMVPIDDVLARIPLIVRGLRATTGKGVRVHIEASSAELDKAVADRVFPALVHLVRNAVDHGIEPPAVRRQRGKPEEGSLWIRISEPTGDRLQIEVGDDGGGIDDEALASRLGRPRPGDEAELLAMLAEPGVSTRDEVTTTSGRGFGMDIVHRIVVRELGGELALRNQPGKGATFALRIPFTVSIIEGLSFSCENETFVVPMSSVEEIVDLDEVRVVTVPSPPPAERPFQMVHRHGRVVPFAELADIFELRRDGRGGGLERESRSRKAILVGRATEAYAFGVDRMLGQQEVVLRPLEDPLVRVRGVAGATDLGDGRPTLVLDLLALGGGLSQPPTEGASP